MTWEALVQNGTSEQGRMSENVDPMGSAGTSYLITGLDRLTTYTVFVHATNYDGSGMNSRPVMATTTATGEHNTAFLLLLRVLT